MNETNALRKETLEYARRVAQALDLLRLLDPPAARSIEAKDVEDASLLDMVGCLARTAGYVKAHDPLSIGEAYRTVSQIARDHNARILTSNLPTVLPTWGSTLGGSPFVLYLRSFNAPLISPIVPTDLGLLSLEEILANYFDSPWPLIGLGRLEQVQLGAGKIRCLDESWRTDLRKLSLNATLILVVPSVTEGTSWEIEWVAVNDNLRNSVFLMPPALSDEEHWDTEWVAVQRWARFMKLAFPDYNRDGLLFTMDPSGPVLRSVRFGRWVGARGGSTSLMALTGVSTDWMGDAKRSVLAALEVQEAREQGVDLADFWAAKEREKREAIRARVDEIGIEGDHKFLPMLERLDTIDYTPGPLRGRHPGRQFWECEGLRDSMPGVYTVWWEENDLIWADSTINLGKTLNEHASGITRGSPFCSAVFENLVLPSLGQDVMRDFNDGLIDRDKMTRYHIHKYLSVLYEQTENLDNAKRIAFLIQRGVLGTGAPRLTG